jgi:signal peptide peptidase SppA
MMHHMHLASRLYGTPLLITRVKLDVILSVLGSRIGLSQTADAGRLDPTVIDSATALPGSTDQARSSVATSASALTSPPASNIAVIPVHGTLVRRTVGLDAVSGLTSYDGIGARLDTALNDPRIEGILLDIDSPGGEAGGVFELAQRIRAVNDSKPVWAHANDAAYSAAYAIAAAASRLTLSRTAGVGSIGVIALHVDQSVRDANDGLAFTAIHAGQRKNDFSPHAPLSPQAAASLQNEVDRLYGIFVEHVATMRGMSSDAVCATEAGLLFGDAAVQAGLADAVIGLHDLLGEFADALAAKRSLRKPAPVARQTSVNRPFFDTESNMQNDELDPARQETARKYPSLEQDGVAAVNEPAEALQTLQTTASQQNPVQANPAQPGASANAISEAQAIAELCLIAGAANRTAEFLAAGMNAAQVRRVLLDARAEQAYIVSHITADAAVPTAAASSPVIDAVKKLVRKD